jgi:hypothetical protein
MRTKQVKLMLDSLNESLNFIVIFMKPMVFITFPNSKRLDQKLIYHEIDFLHAIYDYEIIFFCGVMKVFNKAELLQEFIFFRIHFFAREVLVMKKLEIKKSKPTFIVSVLKVEYYLGGLSFFDFQLFY